MMIAFLGMATIFSSCTKDVDPPVAGFYIYETEVEMGEELFTEQSSSQNQIDIPELGSDTYYFKVLNADFDVLVVRRFINK
jgi:hypothetical protein